VFQTAGETASSRPVAHVFDSSAASTDVGSALALQKDGKLVLAGLSLRGGHYKFGLVRYQRNGSVDTSFGTRGIVLTALGTDMNVATAIVEQDDGKAVVAGGAYVSTHQGAFALARYTRRGALDPAFGRGGEVLTPLGGPPPRNKWDIETARSLVLQPDGRIIAAGFLNDVVDTERVGIVRYRPTGALDATFGKSGKVVADLGTRHDSSAQAVALQHDGKVVVAGSTLIPAGLPSESSRFALARFTGRGELDAHFGTGGKVIAPPLGYWDQGNAVVLQADGKIVVAGIARMRGGDQLGLARFLPNGAVDTAFGNNGTVVTNFAVLSPPAIALQPDGKIVVACGLNGPRDFGLGRYETDGTLDTTFGVNGKVRTRLPTGSKATTVLIQTDGKIVAGGSSGGDFALVRYTRDGDLDTSFGRAGVVTTPLGPAWIEPHRR
jgi:uncharacterized delta-60 repeat protein